eukprot:jgi/Galph1/5452/GphlegSOOS_G4029.1
MSSLTQRKFRGISPQQALQRLCETVEENELTEQVKQEVIQELVETWEHGRAVNVNYAQDKAAVAGAAVNEQAVIEYLQARAQALCEKGLLDEEGMHAILTGRLQRRDSAYKDIENAVNAHWPPRKQKDHSETSLTDKDEKELQRNPIYEITNSTDHISESGRNFRGRRATIVALGDAFSQAYENIINQKSKWTEYKDFETFNRKVETKPVSQEHENTEQTPVKAFKDMLDNSTQTPPICKIKWEEKEDIGRRNSSFPEYKTDRRMTQSLPFTNNNRMEEMAASGIQRSKKSKKETLCCSIQ